MKTRITFIILTLVAFALGACRKKEDAAPKPYFLKAQKNGVEWNTERYAAGFFQDTLYISGSVGERLVSIHIKFTGKGKYAFTGKQADYTVLFGGDQVSVLYYPEPGAENMLNITGYDETTKEIWGNFTLNFLRDPFFDTPNSPYPPKLALTDGSFKMIIDN